MGRHSGDRGSSLVETLVASLLLVLLLAPLVSLFTGSRLTALDSGRKAGAVNVARTWMERFLGMDWAAMDTFLASPSNGFTEVTAGEHWERAYAPDPDRPAFDVQVVVRARQLRPPESDDAMPDQLTVRDITVTVRWPYKDSYYTVQQATTVHKR